MQFPFSAVLGAISAVFAGPLARKIGLVNTMVFTHAPSSAAVLFFPLPPPTAFWAVVLLLMVRAGLNMMDQAPRTALIAAVVRPDERTAVMGITSTLRTLASMAGPSITGLLAAGDRFWVAFVVAGACRLAYDFGLWAVFVDVRLHQHEEVKADGIHHRSGGRRRQGDEEEVLEMARLSPRLSSEEDGEEGGEASPRPSAAFSSSSAAAADDSSDGSDDDDDDDNDDDVVKLDSPATISVPRSTTAGSLQVPRSDSVRSRSPHRVRAPDV